MKRSATFQVATPAGCWRYIFKGDPDRQRNNPQMSWIFWFNLRHSADKQSGFGFAGIGIPFRLYYFIPVVQPPL
jgi:hypothetical protein